MAITPIGAPAQSSDARITAALLGTPVPTPKEAFLGSSGKTKTTVATKRPMVKKLSDTSSRYIKIGLYGASGMGKTFGLADLVERHGMRILVLSTDVGGDGLNTLSAELNARGRGDLMDTHVYHVTLSTYEEVSEFCEKPELFFPEVYDVDLDMLVLDGFSGLQQYQIPEYVESLDTVYDKDGKLNGQRYWGEVRTATSKILNKFLYRHNKKTGKLWSKYVTMLASDAATEASLLSATTEAERQKLRKDVKVPFIQGSAAKLIEPSFDFFGYCTTRRIEDPKDSTKKITQYVYRVEPSEKQRAKVRGCKFDPIIPANMGDVWAALVKAYMVTPGQVSVDVVEGVEVLA